MQYNNLEFDESGKPDEVVLEKVVLDFDPETKEPLIEVDRGLVKKLKPHQVNLAFITYFDKILVRISYDTTSDGSTLRSKQQ